MLDRYRKPGGFLQLLNLIETCGQTKQEKFLEMIRLEDARWAEMLIKKMLTMKIILSWSPETLAEVFGNLNDLTIAVILHGLAPADKEKVYKTFSSSKKRKVESQTETHQPTPAEISTMFMKVLAEVRKMISDGRLRMDKIDPNLVIEDDIEEKLKRAPGSSATPSENEVVAVDGSILHFEIPTQESQEQQHHESRSHESEKPGENKDELTNLRQKVVTLNQENQSLKQEVTKLKSKIEQIRKIV